MKWPFVAARACPRSSHLKNPLTGARTRGRNNRRRRVCSALLAGGGAARDDANYVSLTPRARASHTHRGENSGTHARRAAPRRRQTSGLTVALQVGSGLGGVGSEARRGEEPGASLATHAHAHTRTRMRTCPCAHNARICAGSCPWSRCRTSRRGRGRWPSTRRSPRAGLAKRNAKRACCTQGLSTAELACFALPHLSPACL